MSHFITAGERYVARLLNPRILSTAASLLSNKMHNISIKKKRFIISRQPNTVNWTLFCAIGRYAVTNIHVNASSSVFTKPALRKKASCLTGSNGNEYKKVSTNAIAIFCTLIWLVENNSNTPNTPASKKKMVVGKL